MESEIPNSLPRLAAALQQPAACPKCTARSRFRETAGFWRKMFAFAGPGYLVAVGYMDPGNWATDLAGGARFGYTLLSVIMISNLMAILLQALAARLGIASGRDLAQACRDSYSRPVDDRAVGPLRDRDRRLRPGRGASAPPSRSTCCSACRSSGASASPRSTC